MRWKVRKTNIKPHAWRPFFCLLPRIVEGYWVWLEFIERRWMETGAGAVGDFTNVYEYRLADGNRGEPMSGSAGSPG